MAWKASGLKKGDFADKCGVSRHMMSRYMSGKSSPSFDRASAIVEQAGYKIEVTLPLSDEEYFDLYEKEAE